MIVICEECGKKYRKDEIGELAEAIARMQDSNGCVVKQKRIHSDMQHLILEAARRKDENISREARPSVVSVIEELEPFESDHLFRLP